jgi:hypothetical protein
MLSRLKYCRSGTSDQRRILSMIDHRIQDDLQGPATKMLRSVKPFAPIAPELVEPLPNYVEHRDGATELGRLSAEAVVREYEAAAKAIESLGLKLVEQVRFCEAMCRELLAVIEELKETAGHHREEAKRIFLHIESCSQMAADVRRVCADLKSKVSVPASAEKPRKARKLKAKTARR